MKSILHSLFVVALTAPLCSAQLGTEMESLIGVARNPLVVEITGDTADLDLDRLRAQIRSVLQPSGISIVFPEDAARKAQDSVASRLLFTVDVFSVGTTPESVYVLDVGFVQITLLKRLNNKPFAAPTWRRTIRGTTRYNLVPKRIEEAVIEISKAFSLDCFRANKPPLSEM